MYYFQLFFTVFLIGLYTSAGSLTAQSTRYVIAPSGLSVRAAPNLKGELIGRVNFGDSLVTVSDTLYGIDTLYEVKNYGFYNYWIGPEEIYGNSDYYLVTQWFKINHQVNIAYVASLYTSTSPIQKSDEPIVYIDRHNTTWGLSFHPAHYQWYGLFYDSTTLSIKNISVDFIEAMSETSGAIIKPIYANKRNSLGIIGSKIKWQEGALTYDYLYTFDTHSSSKKRFTFTQLDTNKIGYGEEFLDVNYLYAGLDTNTGKTTQFLLNGISRRPGHVRLRADIDGDQVNDYILFCYTIYDVHEIALFLSTDMVDGVYHKSASSTLDFD